MTPLDFRLTAAVIFRLVALECSTLAVTVNEVRKSFLAEQLVAPQVLSGASLTAQSTALRDKFFALLAGELASSQAGELYTVTVRQSRIYSAVHTNAFLSIAPGSDQPRVLENYYPRHENATYANVSRRDRSGAAQNSCCTHGVKF